MKAISGKQFCKVLEKNGWILKRTTKSSHFIYTKPGNPATISVPVHANQDLKKGMQADLMKQAGLTKDDLQDDAICEATPCWSCFDEPSSFWRSRT